MVASPNPCFGIRLWFSDFRLCHTIKALESRPQSTITAFLRMSFHGAAGAAEPGPDLQNIVALKQWQFGLAVRWRGLAGGTFFEKPP